MSSSLSHRRTCTHLGMDVHKDSISIGILRPDEESPDVERIFNDEPSIRRFLARFDEPRPAVEPATRPGPTGYELHRLLDHHEHSLPGGRAGVGAQSAGGSGEDRSA